MTNTLLRMMGLGRNASPPRPRANRTNRTTAPRTNRTTAPRANRTTGRPAKRPPNLTNEEWRWIQANIQAINSTSARTSTGNTAGTTTPRARSNTSTNTGTTTTRANAITAKYPLVVPRAAFVVKHIPGDGDCLFASVAQACRMMDGERPLPRTALPDAAMDLRLMTVNYLSSHADPGPILRNPASGAAYNGRTSQRAKLQDYLAAMSTPGVFGTEREVVALASIVDRNIVLYQPLDATRLTRWPAIYTPRRGRSRDTIVLLYDQYAGPGDFEETGHFDVLLPRRG